MKIVNLKLKIKKLASILLVWRHLFFYRKLNKNQKLYFDLVTGGLFVVLIPVSLTLTFQPNKAAAAWYNDNWGYRQTVAVTNSGSAQTNFQVPVILDTATLITAGKMQSNCADIRITDVNGKVLPYWIDTGAALACNTATTYIWTKVASIPTSPTTLFIYYGNPSATSAQSGSQVFDFFDDFNDNNVTDWTQYEQNAGDATWSASGGILTAAYRTGGTGGAEVFNSTYTVTDGIVEAKTLLTSSGTNDQNGAEVLNRQGAGATAGGYSNVIYKDDASTKTNKIQRTHLATLVSQTWAFSFSTWYTMSLSTLSTTISSTVDAALGQSTTNATYASGKAGLGAFGLVNSSATAQFDDFRVRKNASTMPTTALSNEEKSPAPVAFWKFNDATGTTAKDSTVQANNGTLAGATLPTWQTEDQCVSGKCLFFNGSASNVTAANIIYGVQTVSMWVKPTSVSSSALIDLDGGTHYITVSSGTISATGFTSPTIYVNGVVSSTLSANTWQYVTVTTGTGFNSSSSLTIAKSSATYLQGFIDEVKIYDYARTANQVKTDFNARGGVKGASTQISNEVNNNPNALNNGLVGYWKMDQSSWNGTAGEAVDSSGVGNNGTAVGGATTGAGKYSYGGAFDGSNDYVNCGDSPTSFPSGAADRTITGWIKGTAFSGDRTVAGWGVDASGQLSELRVNSSGKAEFHGYSNDIAGSTTLSTGSWYHLAATVTGTAVKIYVNGVQDGSGTVTLNTSATNCKIARQPDFAGQYFNGTIDEVRFYNRALSGADVANLYNFAPGPKGYWRFEEGTGTTTADFSSNGNTGTWSGTTTSIWTLGKYGNGGKFNGSNNYVNVPSSSTLQSTQTFTIEAWANATSFSGTTTIVSYTNGGNPAYKIDFNSSGLPRLQVDTTYANCTSTIATNTWTHVAFTYDNAADTAICYINGVLDNKTTSYTVTPATPTSDLSIGALGASSSEYFAGLIDEVKFYNYVRTAGQIVVDMNAGHPAPGSPVGSAVGWWRFNEGADGTCTGGTNDACNTGSAGSTLDGAGNGFSVPATATSGWTSAGKFGKALLFDGTGDYVEVGDPSGGQLDFGTGDFSISFWIKTTNTSRWDPISKIPAGANVPYYAFYWLDATNFTFQVTDGTSTGTVTWTTPDVTDGAWHQLTGIRSGTNMYIYRDGKLVATATGQTQVNVSNTGSFMIGRHSTSTTVNVNGTMDEVKVYNGALTANQVKLDYNQSSAQVQGALSDKSTYQPQAQNQEYCVPGDSATCAAPVGEWKYEEGSGTAYRDTSGNNNGGSGTGTPAYIPGKLGKGLSMDASNDYVTVTNASSLYGFSTMTVQAWVWLDSNYDTADNPNLLGKMTANQGYRITQVGSTGKMQFGIGTGSSEVFANSTNNFPTDQWVFVTGVYNGSTVSLYFNGASAATPQSQTGTVGNNGTNLYFGTYENNVGDASSFWDGKIDQMRIFNYARTPAQIAWDYNKGAPVGWWKTDECQGTTINDSAGNSLTGTLTIGGSGTQTTAGTCTTNAATPWYNGRNGKINASLNYDGNDDYTEVADSASLTSSTATLSSWIYITGNPANRDSIISKYQDGSSANSEYNMWVTSAGAIQLAGNGTDSISGGSIPANTWTHVVGVINGASSAIYVNGRQVATGTVTAGSNTTTTFRIGGTNNDTSQFFAGQIDDARFFNYPVTASQIKTLYSNGALNFAPVTGTP